MSELLSNQPRLYLSALIGCLALITAPAQAASKRDPVEEKRSPATRFVQTWSASCAFASGPVRLTFRSSSGDPTNDDMTLRVQSSRSAKSLPIAPALYVADGFKSATASRCDRVAAYEMPSGNVLLILIRDDRPSEDQVVAYLAGPNVESIIAGPTMLGRTTKSLAVVPESRGMKVRVQADSSAETTAFPQQWIRVRAEAASIRIERE